MSMNLDEARLNQIEGRIDRAGQATSDLRAAVEALHEPIALIAEIKQENQEIRRKTDDAAEKAALAKKTADARASRGRTSWIVAGAVGIAVLLMVTALTFAVLLRYVHGLLEQEQAGRYRACVTRNAAVQVQVKRERILAALDGISAAERQAHADSATDLQRLLINCEQYQESR
jgi:hypothetical protein